MQHVQYSYIVVHILCCSFENRILWSYRPKLTPQRDELSHGVCMYFGQPCESSQQSNDTGC